MSGLAIFDLCEKTIKPVERAENTTARPYTLDVSHAARGALRRRLIHRLVRNAGIVSALVLAALGLGAIGYHVLEELPWLDAILNAAMILTGMGPVNPISTPAAKVFAIAYALFSGVFFLTMVALLLAPALHHFLHRFHLDLSEQESRKAERPQRRDGPSST